MGIRVGEEFHTEVSSSDASAGVAATLHAQGSVATRALATGEIILVSDLIVSAGAALTVTVESTDGSNSIAIFKGSLAANSTVTHHFATPTYGLRGSGLKVTTSGAGQIDVIVNGSISH